MFLWLVEIKIFIKITVDHMHLLVSSKGDPCTVCLIPHNGSILYSRSNSLTPKTLILIKSSNLIQISPVLLIFILCVIVYIALCSFITCVGLYIQCHNQDRLVSSLEVFFLFPFDNYTPLTSIHFPSPQTHNH